MIYILGLDGLEHEFVEKWECSNLKQREYGKIKVPINKFGRVPTTPQVWMSFLCGKRISIDFGTFYLARTMIVRILKFARKYADLSLGLAGKVKTTKQIRGHFSNMTVENYLNQKLNQETFLDITNSEKINVPYYNYDDKAREIVSAFGKGKISMQETVAGLNLIYETRKQQILETVETVRNKDVVFAYMHYPDILQHFFFHTPSKIRGHYVDLENFVSLLKRKLDDSTLFLIISDHGFDLKTETHSTYGFYSSNVNLDPKPERITDFYEILCKSVRAQVPLHSFR